MNDNQQREELAHWIEDRLKPDVYVVATLKQGIISTAGGYLRGTEERYIHAWEQFIHRLSHRIYRKAYRRFGTLLPHAMMIEGGSNIVIHTRWHLNINIRRPDWVPFEDLETVFREEWAKIEWAMGDVYFNQRTGDCVGYSLKDGPEALLASSLSF